MAFDLLCDLLYRFRVLTERNAAALDVRTRDIDLHHIHTRFICKPFYDFAIVLCRLSAYIYDDCRIVLFKKREIPGTKRINPRVLQADRIHHASPDLGNARSRISGPRHIRHALCNDCSQP